MIILILATTYVLGILAIAVGWKLASILFDLPSYDD